MPAFALRPNESKVPDPELRDWVARHDEDRREVIVEAATPERKVEIEPGKHRGAAVVAIRTAPGPSRGEILDKLRAEVAKLLGADPVVLTSAGALALEATGEETARLLDHPRIGPLVRMIRANRTLSAPHPRRAQG